jgi:hypothetical protein
MTTPPFSDQTYGAAGCRCWVAEAVADGVTYGRWMPNASCPHHGIRAADVERPVAGPCGCPCDACSHYCERLDYDPSPGPADCAWGDPFRCRTHCPNGADGRPVCTPGTPAPDFVALYTDPELIGPKTTEKERGVFAAIKRRYRHWLGD